MPIQQGIEKASLQSLGQIKDRMTFLYVEHCIINKQDGSITVTDARGTVHVPAAVSYTHLDVYKRQDIYGKIGWGRALSKQ